jgi:glycosyltransferase involved in cell wall biosynthesis
MISVIIPTFNRARVLEETVRNFLECQTDGVDYELLIVDNNSTDRTKEFAEQLALRIPRIRYIFEPLQGANRARNRGIRESRGEIVAFVDDDVYFSPCWLTALESTFQRRTDVACIGGKVVAHFDDGRPSWLHDDQLWIYGVTRYGDHEREIQPPEIPIGCNMAFRRTVFDQIGNFHLLPGRKGGNLLSIDENHLLFNIAKAGLKTLYSPAVQVTHRMPSARTSRRWVLKRYYWQGVSDIVLRQLDDGPISRVILTKQAIRKLFGLLRRWKEIAGLLSSRKRRDGGLHFKNQLDICYKLGVLRQVTAELFSVPDGNAANSGHRGSGK